MGPDDARIVREPELRRLAAAARAVLAEFDRVRALVGHRPDLLAHLYAGRAVRADDEYGRDAGLVIQADELRWAEVERLMRVAEEHLDEGAHAGVGTWHPGCADCEAVLVVARVRSRYRFRTVPAARDLPPGASGRSRPGGDGTGSQGRGPP
jgi:hypothetical protein